MYPQVHYACADGPKRLAAAEMLAARPTSPDNLDFALGHGQSRLVADVRVVASSTRWTTWRANPPLCPEVLDELAEYFIGSTLDLLDRTQRLRLPMPISWPVRETPTMRAAANILPKMNAKCFTAEQLYDCIAVATRVDVGGMQIPDGALSTSAASTIPAGPRSSNSSGRRPKTSPSIKAASRKP